MGTCTFETRGHSLTVRTTIIMPVYNTAHAVIRAIDSVLHQTDPDFELIIVNDASPDHADHIITEHLKKVNDSRVRYFLNEQNIGLSETRNRGLSQARGQWLAFLDSDDAFTPTFLERMHHWTNDEIDVVVCAHDVVTRDGNQRTRLRGKTGIFTGHEAMLKLLRDETTPYVWDKIFRASTATGHTFPTINRIEDAAYIIPIYQKARKVRFIEESLCLYSVNPHSVTWGSVPPIQEMYRYMNYLKENTQIHQGSKQEQDALAVTWCLAFLNGAQSALRLGVSNAPNYLKQCQQALAWHIVVRALRTRPVFGAAAFLFKLSPKVYQTFYTRYVQRAYGID